MRGDGRIVGGEGWQEKVRDTEEWKKLLRAARNRCILHVPMEWNERNYKIKIKLNTNVMQQDADFITADFLYMFRASSAHHQEYKLLTRQPPIQVVL